MNDNNDERTLNEFQIRNVRILTHMLTCDAIDDEIVECLRRSELDYFSLTDKYKLLEQKVNIDEKTNLLKYKNDYLTNIIKTASRIYFGAEDSKYAISFIRFDIDNFSIFNNKYGHELGDQVLVEFAATLRERSRPTDYAIRFGGEEFDVILPSTDIEGTEKYLDSIFETIRGISIKHGGEDISITVSAGVSFMVYSFQEEKRINETKIEEYFKKLQSEADDALYEAKFSGKDRYCIFSRDKKEEYLKMRDQYSNKDN